MCIRDRYLCAHRVLSSACSAHDNIPLCSAARRQITHVEAEQFTGVWVPQLLLSLSLDGTQLSKHRLDGLCLPSTTNSVEGWFGTKMNQVSVHNVHSLLESWLHALDSQLAPNTESGMSFA
eukprot:TRINITY_DN4212_c0_g1_i3.p1 TRINITY_DN4212_c0_g1~~TRINITY_DN4212_c0_g1_i3.p1  ORF type:complete len:121 (+),score=22.26 TRINITY_DN4212_c0_g1_i3:138-500(+)